VYAVVAAKVFETIGQVGFELKNLALIVKNDNKLGACVNTVKGVVESSSTVVEP
jgi:hypothetical protein